MHEEQLAREQTLLAMPFLDEDLPFLAEFDDVPWVSVEEVVDIVTTETTTAIDAPDKGSFSPPEFRFEELVSRSAAPFAAAAPSASSGATLGPDAFKKSCRACTDRRIKCEILPGSSPKQCKHCQDESLPCLFELKKAYKKA